MPRPSVIVARVRHENVGWLKMLQVNLRDGVLAPHGGDQPVNPQPWRQVLDQRGEDRAVGPVQPGPRTRPAQHGDLMQQHEQLRILGCRGPAKQDQPAAETHEDEIEKAYRHESS
jgi:hypothetical protein